MKLMAGFILHGVKFKKKKNQYLKNSLLINMQIKIYRIFLLKELMEPKD